MPKVATMKKRAPTRRSARYLLVIAAMALVAVFLPASRAVADGTGNLLYSPARHGQCRPGRSARRLRDVLRGDAGTPVMPANTVR